ncbi:carbohydrate sulfotransferase 12-like [Oryzias latipes]|uniref:carbohydrate sulfotransferase 12-like n=1 Tax=Oryzias latipes TaxID=8090 RepID=UPI0005CBD2DB|nr:carbohydrate sulfotransferase 12-like [Oryzias latipes]XP_011485731.1 carbohydrate sulfotransferase 12-like [Oryzias latipes]
MRSNKGLMIIIFMLGCTFFITLTTHGWDFYQQNIALRSTKKQDLRKDLLRKYCAGVNQSLDDLKDTDLKNFIVDDKHGIIYCYIPKVACTNWKRTLIALNYSEPYPDPTSFEHNWVHDSERFQYLNDFPKAEREAKLKHYTKFLFVRDPFVRLISAYRDKMLNYNQYFYEGYVRLILLLYKKQTKMTYNHKVAKKEGLQPSFYEFIQYILDPRTEKKEPFEPHWRQMYRLCHPCLIEYDFVGHQESLQEDAQELLKMLKLEDDIKFPPSYENMTSGNSVMDWYQSVPLEDRRKLYRIYEEDFLLFGYRRPTELLDD